MMGGRNRHAFLLFSPSCGGSKEGPRLPADDELELDEVEDIWGCQPETRASVLGGRKLITLSTVPPLPRRRAAGKGNRTAQPPSLPVTIPDWSKILRRQESMGGGCSHGRRAVINREDADEVEEEEEEEVMVPPHEVVGWTRRRGISRLGMGESFSFSMEEGIGRTLKGRDLSRVRDAIWEKIGRFQD